LLADTFAGRTLLACNVLPAHCREHKRFGREYKAILLEGSTDSVPENEQGSKLSWSYQMEVLFDALLEQNRLCKRADGGVKSDAWTAALAAVQAEYNLGSKSTRHY
jgi:hypothetical protein